MNTSNDRALNKAVEILKAEFNPIRLFLFGSRANGTATEDSDYDFVMVVKECDDDSQLEYMRRARSLLAKQGIGADIFIYSTEDFEQRRNDFNTIPEVAFSTGREIELNE